MKRYAGPLAVGAVAMAMAIAAGYIMRSSTGPSPKLVTAAAKAIASPASAAMPTTQQQRLLSDPRVKAYEAQVGFQKQARGFFADAKHLAPAQRELRAQALREQIAPREASGELSAGEAMLLEIGLIQATVPDVTEQARLGQRVIDRYRTRTEQREREWAQRPKPQFDAYKRREADIVREVMAMPQVPAGLGRDEYLRQRLQQAREQIYL
ncbi:MAG: hypothetical protein ACREP7_12630, partial [Lysobacter sp.]